MNAGIKRILGRTQLLLFVLVLVTNGCPVCGESKGGKVVWWGGGLLIRTGGGIPSGQTNGVLEMDGQILTNIVAISAKTAELAVLKADNRVAGFGFDGIAGVNAPTNLPGVVAIRMTDSLCWAVNKDGTVAYWGQPTEEAQVLSDLVNVRTVDSAGLRGYSAVKKDGTVWGFQLEDLQRARSVVVAGRALTSVKTMAPFGITSAVLKENGTVFVLGYQRPGTRPPEPVVTVVTNGVEEGFMVDFGGESDRIPYSYTTLEPVVVDGLPLSNVVAITTANQYGLALRRDGTVVSWGSDINGERQVPAGLSNVVAIAAGDYICVALRKDGTVVSWGSPIQVPAGLSNVVAIAAGGGFGAALTTGEVPASVFIPPSRPGSMMNSRRH